MKPRMKTKELLPLARWLVSRRSLPFLLAALLVATAFAGTAQAAQPRYTVYYQFETPTRFWLFPVQILSSYAIPAPVAVLNALIEGPPQGSFVRRTIPAGTELLGVEVVDETARVNFSAEVLNANVGSEAEAVLVSSIVNTLCLLPGIDAVRILVEGRPVETLAGHIDCDRELKPSPRLVWNGFSDAQGHWAEGSILAFSIGGVLSGYPEGDFRPGNAVTKAEFVKMVVASLCEDPSVTQKQSFDDVPASHWAHGFVERAVELGFLLPADYSRTLNPDRPMPRKEMAMMLVRAAGAADTAARLSGAHLPFSDTSGLNAWLKGFIAAAVDLGLLQGYPDRTFRPDGFLTRAEAATVLARLVEAGESDIVLGWPRRDQVFPGGGIVAGAARVPDEICLEVNRIKRETSEDDEDTEEVRRILLGEARAQVSESSPRWGVFAAAVPFDDPVGATQKELEGEVRAFWLSRLDGTRCGMTQVSVKLRPR